MNDERWVWWQWANPVGMKVGEMVGLHIRILACWGWMRCSLLEKTSISSTPDHQKLLSFFSPLIAFPPLIITFGFSLPSLMSNSFTWYKARLKIALSLRFDHPNLFVDEPCPVSCSSFFWAWTATTRAEVFHWQPELRRYMNRIQMLLIPCIWSHIWLSAIPLVSPWITHS